MLMLEAKAFKELGCFKADWQKVQQKFKISKIAPIPSTVWTFKISPTTEYGKKAD